MPVTYARYTKNHAVYVHAHRHMLFRSVSNARLSATRPRSRSLHAFTVKKFANTFRSTVTTMYTNTRPLPTGVLYEPSGSASIPRTTFGRMIAPMRTYTVDGTHKNQ